VYAEENEITCERNVMRCMQRRMKNAEEPKKRDFTERGRRNMSVIIVDISVNEQLPKVPGLSLVRYNHFDSSTGGRLVSLSEKIPGGEIIPASYILEGFST